MSERERLRMDDDEVKAHLDACYRMQVATLDADGTPHLVPLAYMWFDGALALWTDPESRKVRNLRRDPRITCLIETGDGPHEFRAVQIVGRAEVIDDADTSRRAGEALSTRYGGPLDDESRAWVESLVPVRVTVLVRPERIVSWDHRKLAGVGLEDLGR
jgi:PPOX class probable F420-dependent enzyme